MANTPCSCTCDLPSDATLPSTRSGRKVISGYLAISRMAACIRLSRAGLPLSPLAASTTISPDALPVCGSKVSVPRLRWKSPCTVCSRLPRANSTLVCAGSMANERGSEATDTPAEGQPIGKELGGGLFADVHGEHAREEIRLSGKRADPARAQAAALVEQEHEVRQEFGAAADAAVLSLILREIAGSERAGQRHGLLEEEA